MHSALDTNYGARGALQTHLSPSCGGGLHRRVEFGQVPGDLGHKPLETLAVKGAAELLLGGDVPSREVAVLGPALVNVLGVLIHPHLRHSLQVLEGDRDVEGSGPAGGGGRGSVLEVEIHLSYFMLHQRL